MEAATAASSGLLLRDGSAPAIPAGVHHDSDREPIDGVARCGSCERFPLLGEQVVRHEGRAGGTWVCAGCESSGRGERLGRITGMARVRSFGGAMNVRRIG